MASVLEDLVKKYDVHPETVSFLQARLAQKAQPYYELGPVLARKSSLKVTEDFGGSVELDGTETEFTVPSPYSKDGIQVTVYRPTSCVQQAAPPIVVYFHGGGNVVGCRKGHETICKIMARDASCLVVNVEYRLAPEHRFPANNDDAKCVVRWVAMNKALIGAVNASAIGVAGDSAGGRLAAVVSHELHSSIQFAVLVYPNVNSRMNLPSNEEFKQGPGLTSEVIGWFLKQYISPEECSSPRASPLLNKEFSYLPPTLIIVAELDPLRDGCFAYYEKLKEAGVETELLTLKGVIHAFWHLPGHYKENCKKAMAKAVEFIKKHSSK